MIEEYGIENDGLKKEMDEAKSESADALRCNFDSSVAELSRSVVKTIL